MSNGWVGAENTRRSEHYLAMARREDGPAHRGRVHEKLRPAASGLGGEDQAAMRAGADSLDVWNSPVLGVQSRAKCSRALGRRAQRMGLRRVLCAADRCDRRCHAGHPGDSLRGLAGNAALQTPRVVGKPHAFPPESVQRLTNHGQGGGVHKPALRCARRQHSGVACACAAAALAGRHYRHGHWHRCR